MKRKTGAGRVSQKPISDMKHAEIGQQQAQPAMDFGVL
jgi:hypothetical protein